MEIIRLLIPSELNKIYNFRENILLDLSKKNWTSDMLFKVKLILDELVINSYKHGNLCQKEKNIELVIISDAKDCYIKVKDEGNGVKFKKNQDRFLDHGRGIQLAYCLSDDFYILGNEVCAKIKNEIV